MRLICEKCNVLITKKNFWAKIHKGHNYIWVDENKLKGESNE
jgi:RNase P subunit RPR2